MSQKIAILFGVAIAIGTLQIANSFPPQSRDRTRRSDSDAQKTSSTGPAKLDPKRVWLEVGHEKASATHEVSGDAPKSEATDASQSDAKASSVSPKTVEKEEKGKENSDKPLDENDFREPIDGTPEKFLDTTPVTEVESRLNIPDRIDETFKCQGVRCSLPPNGLECFEISTPPSMLSSLPTGSCCPVHSCRRNDGSVYYHYAMEMDAPASHQESVDIQAPLPWTTSFQQQRQFNSDFRGPNPPSPVYPISNNAHSSPQFGHPNYNLDVGRQPQQGNPGGFNYPQQGLSLQTGVLSPFAASGSYPPQFGFNNNRRFTPAVAVQKLPEQVPSQIAPLNLFPGIGSSVDSGILANRFSRGASPIQNFGIQTQANSYAGVQAQYGSFDPWSGSGRVKRNSRHGNIAAPYSRDIGFLQV